MHFCRSNPEVQGLVDVFASLEFMWWKECTHVTVKKWMHKDKRLLFKKRIKINYHCSLDPELQDNVQLELVYLSILCMHLKYVQSHFRTASLTLTSFQNASPGSISLPKRIGCEPYSKLVCKGNYLFSKKIKHKIIIIIITIKVLGAIWMFGC